ncbi:hypothetical protein LGQ03_09605 [Loktanella sp. TSTF-M6]|uniref:PepSY domain-containing protein n=1 Tax=Loktanella gaetbuli TaxID=2881335 RepID=A0ABS8BUV0_9RHOB|nr:hypothetical protein [Loktanella gaetbuli]MCB5199495.1 hypothetical protein [Loktanella gaetbuli]
MKRLLLILSLICAPAWVSAQSVEDQIVTQLRAQGFTQIEMNRTLLGRVQLRALSPTLDREMIFNPATGEILRDSWTRRSSGNTVPRVAQPFSNRDRDDDDRDRNDDRDDDRKRSDDRDDDRKRSADRDDDDDDKGRGRGRGRGRGGDDDDDDDDDDD